MKAIITCIAIASLFLVVPNNDAQAQSEGGPAVQQEFQKQNQGNRRGKSMRDKRQGRQQETGQRQGQGKGKGKGKGCGGDCGGGGGKGKGGGGGQSAMASGQGGGIVSWLASQTPTTAASSAKVRAYVKRLQLTLEEEIYARDYYLVADQALGSKKFGNLSSAEQSHANTVAAMITFFGGTPVWQPSHTPVPPATIAEAEAECIAIELMVIGVYDGLIKDCIDRALLKPLNNIQKANYKHLAAVGG